MKDKIAVIKDILASCRELILVLLFLLILFMPQTVNQILKNAGFVKGSFMGFEWQNKVDSLNKNSREMGTLVSQISEQRIPSISTAIEDLEKKIDDPKLKDTLKAIKIQLSGIQTETKKADNMIQHSILQQESILTDKDEAKPVSGWFYAGHVNETKNEWVGTEVKNLEQSKPPMNPGEKVKLISDTYLRQDTQSGFYIQSPVVSVLKSNSEYTATQLGYTHARKGGFFLWLRIEKR